MVDYPEKSRIDFEEIRYRPLASARKNPKKSPVSTKITSGTTHTLLRPRIRVGFIASVNMRTKLHNIPRLFEEANPKTGPTSLSTTSIAGKRLPRSSEQTP